VHGDVLLRGNVDRRAWASRVPSTAVVKAGAAVIYVLHDIKELDLDPAAAGFRVVVSGHSHKPGRTERDGVLYLNPGIAGPRRFRLPVTVARASMWDRNHGEWSSSTWTRLHDSVDIGHYIYLGGSINL